MSDRTDQTIAAATSAGWLIVSREAGGIQFRQPKTWSKPAVVAGCVLLLFWGIGLIVLFLALLDYLIAKDKLAYVTAEQLAAGTGPGKGSPPLATLGGTVTTAAIILGGLLVLLLALGVFAG